MTSRQFGLDGKVAIATGARSGIGRAIAVAMAEAGADVVGVSTSSSLDETRSAVEESGRRFVSIQADLTEMSSIDRIVGETREQFGRIDILVNNAGTTVRAPCIDFAEADWDRVIQVNLKAAFFLAQAVARVFREQGSGGKIINIASLMSYQGGILIPAYTAAKGGLSAVTKTMANEWAADGINVNAIAPGYIATELTEPLQRDPERNPKILERIPAGRWGQPEDIAGMAVFLASPAADYCHGAVYPVDGGWLAR